MSWFPHFESTGPLEARGGIKAHSRRGAFGATWWGRRWIEVLEGFDLGGRLPRGRAYARKGQVLSLDVEAGRVRAKVQGSRPTPYAVTLRLAAHDAAAWAAAGASLRGRPFFAARLLAGALPPELEGALAEAGLPLLPHHGADLETDCSCPDWSNPCKHVAAVVYLLAEAFDQDPFLLFRLRGIQRGDLLAHIVGAPAAPNTAAPNTAAPNTAAPNTAAPNTAAPARPPTALPPVPLAADARFWESGALPDVAAEEVRRPPVPAALPRRLGPFPLWRGATPFLTALETDYAAASQRGLEASEATVREGLSR